MSEIYLALGIFLVLNTVLDMGKKKISLLSVAGFTILFLCLYREDVQIGASLTGMGIGLLLVLLGFVTKGAIGMGDGFVIAVCGLYLGVIPLLLLLMLSFFMAGIFGGVMIWCKVATKKTKLPFVPFLLASSLILYLAKGVV